MHAKDLPSFDSMPKVQGMPHGCAWGLWDQNGQRDHCGTLNLLTPENALEAKKEIQTGISVVLNWPLHNIAHPAFERREPEHKIINLKTLLPSITAHDDEIHINTQSGSQWDGFKHWGHQTTGLYYNGLKDEDVIKSADNGIHHWSNRGGIVGRGVLLDYVAYADRKGIKYDPMSRHEITVADLDAIIADEKLTLRAGDVLIVRSGWVKWYNEASEEQRLAKVKNGHEHCGVKACEETMRWLWDHHFAAIAGDQVAFEAWPPQPPWIIHDFSLALWGEPIGELWDLERLSEICKEQNRWSFFLTSSPLNIHGGVSSPPNVLAIF